MLRLAWDFEANLLIFLCFSIFTQEVCPPAVSCAVTHNRKDLSADKTNMNACRDDVHDCAPAHQNHVSVFFLTPFEVGFELCASCGFASFYLR